MLIAFDLDDTLFPEVDFLKSAQRAIARRLGDKYGFEPSPLMDAIEGPGNVFDRMEAWLRTNVPQATEDAPWMVQYYRAHHPNDMTLAHDVSATLDSLAEKGHHLALVTDGRSGTQRSKIDALALTRWFAPDDIYISDEIGADKNDGLAFRQLQLKYPAMSKMYVGDNPAKDFIWPNRLGWATVMLRDKGDNIHPQPPVIAPDHRAQYTIEQFTQIKEIVNGK